MNKSKTFLLQKQILSTILFVLSVGLARCFNNKNQYISDLLTFSVKHTSVDSSFSSFSEKVGAEPNLEEEEQVISFRGGGRNVNSSFITSVEKPLPNTRGPRLSEYKQKLKLSKRQKDIAVGVMLGDASLQTQDKGKSYRLKFQGSQKHLEYGQALYREFEPFCLSQLFLFDRTDDNNNVVKSWSFQTLSHQELCSIANLFFDPLSQNVPSCSKKVIIPGLVENHLSPTGLAHWFMDDGSKMDHTKNEGKGFHLHTQGFKEEEVESLCNGLNTRYGLKCWKTKNKGKCVVAISGESYEKFVDLIKSDLLPSMQYKIPSERKKK